jgi:replication factor A1
LFANGKVNMANTKYTSIKNDYSIVFDKNSQIEPVGEDSTIKSLGFCFTSIDEINEFEQMRTIDAIGIIHTIGPVTQVNIKQSGTVKDRRNVTIVDESCLAI